METSGFEGAVLRMLEAGTAFDGDWVRAQIVKLMASAMRCLSEMGMGADVNASDALELLQNSVIDQEHRVCAEERASTA